MIEKSLSDRALRVAIYGYIPKDDPHVIADMQAEIERLTAERDRLQNMLTVVAKHPDTPLLIKQYARGDLDPREPEKRTSDAPSESGSQ